MDPKPGEDRVFGEAPPAKKTRVEAPETAAENDEAAAAEHPAGEVLLGLASHHLDPPTLPTDWVAVPHASGATVYLHKPSRVVTLSRPYYVSTSTTIKKHNVYVQSIPCLEQWLFGEGGREERSELAQRWHTLSQGRLNRIGVDRLREYLALRWDSSLLSWQQTRKDEKSADSATASEAGGERGEGTERTEREAKREAKRTLQKKKQQPLVPEGLSRMVSVRVPREYWKMVTHPEGKKPPPVWEVNLANKNSTGLLYEFCQLYLHTSPDFSFAQSKGPPYQCEVKVGGVRYGSGGGANKKIAKLSAASQTLELFLPGAFSDKLAAAGSSPSVYSEEGLQLLSQVAVEDPRAPAILSQAGFPSPLHTLKKAMQWNKGFLSDKLTFDLQPLSDNKCTESHTPSDHTHPIREVPPDHQFECVLQCGGGEGGGREVRVTCVGKKDGQAAAAQAMLKELHPYITNWGALMKLYSPPPPSEAPPPLPPSSVVEGCGLLSGPDQQLLHSLRHSMTALAQQEGSTEPVAGAVKSLTAHLHQAHIRLAHREENH